MNTNQTSPDRHEDRRRGRLRTFDKVALSGLLAATSLSLFGFGAAAAFTSTVVDDQAVDSGTVVLALGADGTSSNRLSVDATNIAAGDTIERSVDLINGGTLDLSSMSLTTRATTSSKLDTDTVQGLHVEIRSCDTPWTEAGTAPGYTYSCAGVESTLISRRPVIQSAVNLAAAPTATAGGVSHLMIELDLPFEADNSMQGQSSVIEYEITGIQRAPQSR